MRLVPLQVGALRFKVRPGTMDEWVVREVMKDYPKRLNVNRGEVVLDVGMNIGAFAVYAAFKGGVVWGVEPDPENLSIATANLRENGLIDRVEVILGGVNDVGGMEYLYMNDKKNRGSHTVVPTLGRRREVMGCVAMQDLLLRVNPAKVKIDCEGAEYKILKSVTDWCNVRVLVFEYHRRLLKDEDNEKYHEILDVLNREFELDANRDAKGWYHLVRGMRR